MSDATADKPKKTVAPLADLQYPTSCFCERCSFYLKWPECLGGAFKGTVCCCEGASSFIIIPEMPKICCKFEQTQCCIDVRAALPTDSDVPCALGICGVMLWEQKPAALAGAGSSA